LSLRRLKFISVTFNNNNNSNNNNNNKEFRTRPVEKQKGMAFGFRKTATAVKKPDRLFKNAVQNAKRNTPSLPQDQSVNSL